MTKTKKQKEKYSYAFPNFLAKAMSKVSMRTQMESSMLSQFLLIIGLTAMVIYMLFSRQMSGFYKFMVIFNLLAGWLLISSYLVTTYQQYTSYMGAMGFDPAAEKAAVKRKGNIFKRIIRAIKNKKKKKVKGNEKPLEEPKEETQEKPNGMVPDFVNDALKNMEKKEDVPKESEQIPKENINIDERR